MVGEDYKETLSNPAHADLDVSREALGITQIYDPTLVNARELVTVVNRVSHMPHVGKRFAGN